MSAYQRVYKKSLFNPNQPLSLSDNETPLPGRSFELTLLTQQRLPGRILVQCSLKEFNDMQKEEQRMSSSTPVRCLRQSSNCYYPIFA